MLSWSNVLQWDLVPTWRAILYFSMAWSISPFLYAASPAPLKIQSSPFDSKKNEHKWYLFRMEKSLTLVIAPVPIPCASGQPYLICVRHQLSILLFLSPPVIVIFSVPWLLTYPSLSIEINGPLTCINAALVYSALFFRYLCLYARTRSTSSSGGFKMKNGKLIKTH